MRKIAIAAALLLGSIHSANAAFLDGYLAQCSAVGAGTCTEVTATGYARQPISFSDAVRGQTANSTPYTFGSTSATIAGRAVYDAVSGGNLIAVLPLASPLATPPVDTGDINTIRMTITPLIPFQRQTLYSGTVAAGSSLGTTADGSTVTAGVKGVIRAGVLTTALPSFDASFAGVLTQTSGFALTTLTNQATLVIGGAGTLAAGSITLPSAPLDGQTFRLACAVTVTSLTITASSGKALVGSVSTCGANAGHEWIYNGANTTWYTLF